MYTEDDVKQTTRRYMEKRYIRAIAKRDGRPIQGLFADDNGKMVCIISGGEPFYCMHELYDFYAIDEKRVLLNGTNCTIKR